MAALSAAQSVVSGQQAYAKQVDVSALFEILTIALLSRKPDNVLGFLHEQLSDLAQQTGTLTMPAVRL
jgi:hypothetical protein